jgi:hypothetical protein
MSRRLVVISLTVACFLAELPALGQDRFRVVLERQGNSGIDIHLADVNDRSLDLPPGSKLHVTIINGELRQLSGAHALWQRGYDGPADALPDFEFRSTNSYWPDDIEMKASVQPPGAGAVKSKPLVVSLRPKAIVGFLLAFGGALLIAVYKVPQKKRTRVSIAAGLGGAFAAAVIAFFAVDRKIVWQFVGFKDETPVRPQSYFLLGLMISAIGVRPLINKLTGQDESESRLTAQGVHDEIKALLASDALQQPFRDELRAMLFDAEYLEQNPDLAARIEFELAAVKAGRKLPEGLGEYFAPRLNSIYSGSYRRNFQTTIKGAINPTAQYIEWTYSVVYEYVRNAADLSVEPELAFAQTAEIPPRLRGNHAQLMRFGPLFQTLQLTITDAISGTRLVFQHIEGSHELACTSFSPGLAEPDAIPVVFETEEETNQLAAAFSYKLPDALRRHAITVVIDLKYVSDIEDGVSYVRVSRPTHGYRLNVSLPEGVKLEIVEFEWKLKDQNDPTAIDMPNGVAILPGWLMPGNGVCVGWRGTKTAAARVSTSGGTQKQPGMVRRMLHSLPWFR